MASLKRRPHFTPELFAFLRRLARNNRRDWFERNRDAYVEHVRDPMLRFIADFEPHLHAISPCFVADPSPAGGSMFRIHRDVRFARDKRPYKTAASAQFRHERARDVHAPGFYLHLEPGMVFMGAGIWKPDRVALARVRLAIVARAAEWRRMRASKPFRTTLEFEGGMLKRPPRGFDPDHPLIEDLRRTDFTVFEAMEERDACSPGFLPRYARACRQAAPLVRFIAGALDIGW